MVTLPPSVLNAISASTSARQPLDVSLRGLFVSCEKDYQIAVGLPAFALEPDEIGHEHCRPRFVVPRAAPVKPSIALDERPRIGRPVFAARGHDVEMRHQKDRARTRVPAAKPRDQADGLRIGTKHANVISWKPSIDEPSRKRLGRPRRAVGLRRRYFHQFLEQASREVTIDRSEQGLGGHVARDEHRQQGEPDVHPHRGRRRLSMVVLAASSKGRTGCLLSRSSASSSGAQWRSRRCDSSHSSLSSDTSMRKTATVSSRPHFS
jgi:hypothetical protein